MRALPRGLDRWGGNLPARWTLLVAAKLGVYHSIYGGEITPVMVPASDMAYIFFAYFGVTW